MISQIKRLEKIIEEQTGMTAKEIRNYSIDEIRAKEEESGNKTEFYSEHPYIGRGNVNHDIISHEEIESIVTNTID